MYIPEYFKESDEDKKISFIKKNSFAVLVSSKNNLLRATHLPFVIEQRSDELYLVTHIAKANPQWHEFLNDEVLVVFQGPHGYVSPKNY